MMQAIKILISIALIGALLLGLDWQEFVEQIRNMDPSLTLLAAALLTIQFSLSAWKWQKSLAIHKLEFGFWHLQKAIWTGTFFNNFLPTAIGGDAYRAYKTMEPGKPKGPAVSAVVLERLLGIVALALIGLISAIALYLRGSLLTPQLILYAIVAALGGMTLLAVAYWSKGLHFIWNRIAHIEKLRPIIEDLHTVGEQPTLWRDLILLSLAFQIMAIVVIVVLFKAVGVNDTFFASGFTAAAAGVAGILPISVNGIGVVEGSFVLAALEARLPYAEALVVTLFLRLYVIASSIVFGILYALEPNRKDLDPELIALAIKEEQPVTHVPDKTRYALTTILRNPSEILRFAATALSTFRFRFISRCAGPGSIIGSGTVIINSSNVKIGANCLLQDRVYIRAGKDGSVTIGDRAALNSFVQIFGHGGIEIGAEAQIGPNTVLTTTGHDYRAEDLERNFSPIRIGKRAWISSSCTILPGVTIGDNAVIGAGAVVNRDIPANSLAVGVPARVIRQIEPASDASVAVAPGTAEIPIGSRS